MLVENILHKDKGEARCTRKGAYAPTEICKISDLERIFTIYAPLINRYYTPSKHLHPLL